MNLPLHWYRSTTARFIVLGFCTLLLGYASTTFSQETYASGACYPVPGSQTCIDSTPCKTGSDGQEICLDTASLPAGAFQVPYSCWQYSYDYACAGTTTDTCGQYRNNAACGVVKSECNDTIAETGECDEWTYTYQCQTHAEQTTQQMNCTSGIFDDSGFPTPANNNNSFLTGALGAEILGEAQTYRIGDTFFSGTSESCRKGYEGIQNCCKSTPGAKNNNEIAQMALSAGATAVKYVGQKAVDLASPYVFDYMYANGLFGDGTFQFASTASGVAGGTSLASGASLGAYGFTIGTGTMPAGVLGGNIGLMSGSEGYLAFNPYVFAAYVAIQIITQLMSCSQAEQMLALHKGAGLSTYINETCAKSVLGACIQYVDNYCSFNSQLAEIINIQGKTQLGLPLAGCGGLTAAQIEQIDFTKIDFSSFTNQMLQQAEANLPSSSSISTSYQSVEQSSSSGSAQSKTSAVLPDYPSN
jgi:conjugal transfer mating pair stabilization protein TraN